MKASTDICAPLDCVCVVGGGGGAGCVGVGVTGTGVGGLWMTPPNLPGNVAAPKRAFNAGLIAMSSGTGRGTPTVARKAVIGTAVRIGAAARIAIRGCCAITGACVTGGRGATAICGRNTTGIGLAAGGGSRCKFETINGGKPRTGCGCTAPATRDVTTILRASTIAVMYAGQLPAGGTLPSLNCTVASGNRQKRAANNSGRNHVRLSATLQYSNDIESIVEFPVVVPKIDCNSGGACLIKLGISAPAIEKLGQLP